MMRTMLFKVSRHMSGAAAEWNRGTEHQTPEGKYVCGLTNEDVQKAIGILNR